MKIRFLKSLFLLCFFALTVSAQTSNAEKPAETYKIKAGDKLSVRFLNHPELNEPSIAVRPDGFISLQLIEDIKAEGSTAVELRKKIEKGYDEILLNPAISVNIIEFVPPSFFIGGQVNRPGKYSLRDGNSVIKAVFLAGGFTKEANRRMVLYARVDQNGKWQVREINVLKLIEKLSSGDDVAISDGDYIFVPDSKLSKFNKALEGFQSFFPIIPLL